MWKNSNLFEPEAPTPTSHWVVYPFLISGSVGNIKDLPFQESGANPRVKRRPVGVSEASHRPFVVDTFVVPGPKRRSIAKKLEGRNVNFFPVAYADQVSDFVEFIVGCLRRKEIVYVVEADDEGDAERNTGQNAEELMACVLWSYFRFLPGKRFSPKSEAVMWSFSVSRRGPGEPKKCRLFEHSSESFPRGKVFDSYRRPEKVLMIGAETYKYTFASEIDMELLDLPKFSTIFTTSRAGVDTLLFEKLQDSAAPSRSRDLKGFILASTPGDPSGVATALTNALSNLAWDAVFIFDSDLECSDLGITVAELAFSKNIPVWVHDRKRRISFQGDFRDV